MVYIHWHTYVSIYKNKFNKKYRKKKIPKPWLILWNVEIKSPKKYKTTQTHNGIFRSPTLIQLSGPRDTFDKLQCKQVLNIPKFAEDTFVEGKDSVGFAVGNARSGPIMSNTIARLMRFPSIV